MADTNPNLITTCSRLRSVQSQNTDQPMSLSVRDRNAKVTNNASMQYTAPSKCHIQRTNACTHHSTCCWLLAILRGPLWSNFSWLLPADYFLLTFWNHFSLRLQEKNCLVYSLWLPEKNCEKLAALTWFFPRSGHDFRRTLRPFHAWFWPNNKPNWSLQISPSNG